MKVFDGKAPDGTKLGREVFKNMDHGGVVIPENGWNGSPPGPTGILNTHVTDLYREKYSQIRWDS
jgi:hypothetical protein